jgi:hypothetical protein
LTDEERAALQTLLELILKRRLTTIARWLGEHGPEPMALELLTAIEERIERLLTESRQAMEDDPDLRDDPELVAAELLSRHTRPN